MVLDEAIKHCEEVAHQNEILMKRYDDASGYNRSHNEKIRTNGAKGCEQLISLYRQLAEWLKELKSYKEQQPCEDCISREATKEMLMAAWTNYMPIEMDINLSFVLEKISELPSVTPTISDVKNDFNIGYNCGYVDAMFDIAEGEQMNLIKKR